MTAQSTEVQLALLTAGLKEVHRELDEVKVEGAKKQAIQDAKIAALEEERKKSLIWGVAALGTMVAAMAGWIFSKFTSGHIS
jgi:hypothetical protein